MLPLFLLVLLPLSAQDHDVSVGMNGNRHVRTDEPQLRELIVKGMARSVTFASLVSALNESDVIVYIESRIVREGLGGYIPHRVVVAGVHRYVRLVINPIGRDERLMAVMAHEIQHAVEIARAPQVGRSETVEDLFERIGFRQGCPRSCHETIEAMDVERRVREELRAKRRQ